MSTVFQMIRDIIVTLAGVAGLVFGFYKYWKSREAQSVLQFDVSMETFPNEAGNVVDVCLQIKNIGKAAAYVPKAKLKEAVCLIRKVQGEDRPMQLIWEQLEPLDDLGGLEYLCDQDWNLYYPDEPFLFEPGAYETYHVFFRTHYHGCCGFGQSSWTRMTINGVLIGCSHYGEVSTMLVKQFKFKRNNDKGGFQWTAESEIERPGFYRGFHAVGKTLADVKEFAALVRLCERTGMLERLSEMHPLGWEKRMQTTWGGKWHPHLPKGK